VVTFEKPGKPHGPSKGETRRSSGLQLEDNSRQSLEGRRSELLGRRVSRVGREIPGSMVCAGHAFEARTDEDSRQNNSIPQTTDLELVRGQE
jgi:hypothetical protein